jgi:putative membrane-bound dehydrogenase-like protein
MKRRLFKGTGVMHRRSIWCFCGWSLALFIALLISGDHCIADQEAGPHKAGPLSPKEELATFQLHSGFRIELVACEPSIVDPVAMAFDEEGRLFVAEMPGYPNGGVATGSIHSGKIKLLEDRDGDGYYEKCRTYAEGLRLPTSVMPWKGGLLAAVAPDIIFFEDTNGDGRADRQRSVYTGFDLSNSEQLINSLQWGLDNWVYGCAGMYGGTIRSVEKPDMPPVELRSRGVRFHPEQPGSLEPTSGGGQFGLAADDGQRWLTNTNSQHLRHIILPDHYLRRNRLLPISAVTLDIPDHGAACKVYRLSPFEAWRVERTARRARGPDARRFPATELVPGGYITSGCSPVVYMAELFPESYRGNTFICDPANNLVHRDLLVPRGATFTAHRADADHEFLASTDNWFRPVNLTVGPDGALYLADFYREAIETPLSLPDDIKKKVNLESRGRGRIWRIVPADFHQPKRPSLGHAPAQELVHHLTDSNSWWRLTAQRLLVERQDPAAIKPLQELARSAPSPQGRVHALWALQGLHALEVSQVEQALKDPDAGVREQALRLAEPYLARSAPLQKAAVALAEDASPRVRFQLAFTLGEAQSPQIVKALTKILRRDGPDPWTQAAALSSSSRVVHRLLRELVSEEPFSGHAAAAQLQLFTHVAALIGARGQDPELASAFSLLAPRSTKTQAWQIAILEGLGQGLQNSGSPLSRLAEHPSPGLKNVLKQVEPLFQQAAKDATDQGQPLTSRLAAARLLGYAPFSMAAAALKELLAPRYPAQLQLAAVRALALHENAQVADLLLKSWAGYSPSVRREALEALFARPDRLPPLFKAIEDKKVLARQLEPFRIERLLKHPDAQLRAKAKILFAGQGGSDRQKIVDAYRPALSLKGEAARGKIVFKKTCATCHRLDNEGTEVGPDLLSALRNKTPETLLVDMFDPSREVDPRFINYIVTNKAGQVFTGMIAAETASSITLRRAEKAEDTILRNQIEEIQATAKSLMPENLETQLSRQEAADLIAYLQAVAVPK